MCNFVCRYWDLRQQNPTWVQQLPERCYALTVKYPLMVVGTADRNVIIFNLQNPQVFFSSMLLTGCFYLICEMKIYFTQLLFIKSIMKNLNLNIDQL